MIIAIFMAFAIAVPAALGQTHAILLPADEAGEFASGMVYPMTSVNRWMQQQAPPAMLPLEAVGMFPEQERAGKTIVMVNPQLNAPTPIWDVQLSGMPIDDGSEEEEFVPVEREPEFDVATLQRSIVYPREAQEQKIEGTVVVGALVGPEGAVERVRILRSDNEILNAAAATAVAMTPFTPGVANAEASRLWVRIPVTFKLD